MPRLMRFSTIFMVTVAALSAAACHRSPNRSIRLRIEGNADERGSDEYNLARGRRRAVLAQRDLTERGVDSIRIAISSSGEEL